MNAEPALAAALATGCQSSEFVEKSGASIAARLMDCQVFARFI
jgi:hypothetical protein